MDEKSNILKQAKQDIFNALEGIIKSYNMRGLSYSTLRKYYKKKKNFEEILEDIRNKANNLFDDEKEYKKFTKEILMDMLNDRIAHEKDRKNMKKFEKFVAENYDEDLMSDEEIKNDVLYTINKMKHSTNEWTTRDTLKHFTSYGFWSGSDMASIDIETADDIARELYDYVNEFPAGHPNIEEVYDDLYRH